MRNYVIDDPIFFIQKKLFDEIFEFFFCNHFEMKFLCHRDED